MREINRTTLIKKQVGLPRKTGIRWDQGSFCCPNNYTWVDEYRIYRGNVIVGIRRFIKEE